jgi:hypothetical protein
MHGDIIGLRHALGLTMLGWTAAGDCGHRRGDANATGDPDTASLELNLDFGEPSLVKKLSKLPDDLFIEGSPVFGHRRPSYPSAGIAGRYRGG